jgi:1,4-dihydroxy-2-naphthoate octaprenyltransferase
MVGVALASTHGEVDTLLVAMIFVSAGLIQIGTNFHNDYADFKRGADTDERVGPARATQKGWLTPRAVAAGAGACFALSFAFGGVLIHAAGWPILLLGVLSVASGLAYTGGPFPLAYHGLGEVFVFVFFGLAAVVGTVFVLTGGVSAAAWLASVSMGLPASAILVVNNLRDRVTDAQVGKRTLAVRLGAQGARIEYSVFVVGAYLVVALGALIEGGSALWLLPWLSAPLAVRQTLAVWRKDGQALNAHLGGTARLELIFGALLAVGVVL